MEAIVTAPRPTAAEPTASRTSLPNPSDNRPPTRGPSALSSVDAGPAAPRYSLTTSPYAFPNASPAAWTCHVSRVTR